MSIQKRLVPRMAMMATVVAGLLAGSPVFATTEDPAAAGEELSLADIFNIELKTGSFLELDLRKSPVTMTLIDRDMIASSGVRNLSEALEVYVPGFQYMINKWNGVIWGMRGVTGDRNDKIVVLINGKKQNLQNFHGFCTEYTLGLLGDIERIEVLRGPAGLVYGSGAIAGVVNIVTNTNPDAKSFGSVSTNFNGNGFHGVTIEGSLNKELGEERYLQIHAGISRDKGLGDSATRVFGKYEDNIITPDTGLMTFGSPGETPGDFLTSLDYRFKNFRLYARMTRDYTTVGPYIYGWGARRAYWRDNRMVNAEYSVDVGEDKATVELSAIGVSNNVGNIGKDGTTAAIGGNTGERRFDATIKYLMKRVEKLQLAVGGQFGQYDIGYDLNGNTNNAWGNRAGIQYTNIAAFAEGFYSFNDLVSAEAGIRFDKHTKTDGVASPKVAIIVSPTENNTIKLIGQSSSNNADMLTYEPNNTATNPDAWTYEKGALFGPTDSIVDSTGKSLLGNLQAPTNKSLNPEKSLSIELASQNKFGKLGVDASVSINRMTELFLWNGAMKQTQNLGEYNALAGELDLSYNDEKLKIGLNLGVMKPLSVDISKTVSTRDSFLPEYDASVKAWVPKADTSLPQVVVTEDIISTQISGDGKYFNSLSTVTTKLFADWTPVKFVSLHTDARFFWGLWGRKPLVAEIEKEARAQGKTTEFLDMESKSPMVKWNINAIGHLTESIDIGFYAYDLLGTKDSKAAVRWQQMAARVQHEYFTVDQRTFALKFTYKF